MRRSSSPEYDPKAQALLMAVAVATNVSVAAADQAPAVPPVEQHKKSAMS
jgi:hypothetical protein